MTVPFGVDLEAGLESKQSKVGGAGIPFGDDMGCQPGTGNTKGGFGDTSEKTLDLDPTQFERHVDVVLERWKGNTESILLFAGLLSAAISLFVIESYNTSSPDVAVTLFNQLSSLDQPPPPPLLLDAVLLERSSSVVRPTTLWLLSLGLNITCAVWVLWSQWRQQFIDLLGQSGGPHTPARLHVYPFPRVGPRFGKEVEANWVLIHTSVILFFAGLVEFLLLINKTITWIVIGYLTPLAFLYAAATLLPYHSPNSTLFPYRT